MNDESRQVHHHFVDTDKVKRTRVTNTSKVRVIIDAAQIRCRQRIFNYPSEILSELENIENRLRTILPKTHWQGLRFDIHAAKGTMPASYKGVPETTYVRVERGSKDWFITHCARTPLKTSDVFPLNLDERTSEIMETLNRASHWSN